MRSAVVFLRRFRWPLAAGYAFGIILIFLGLVLLVKPYLPEGRKISQQSPVPNSDSAASDFSDGPITIDPGLLSGAMSADSPVRILIPEVGIDVPVTPAAVANGAWETSPDTASHGLGSAYPGDQGNVVIFAHARKGLFLPLREVKEGNSVYVMTSSGWYRYLVSSFRLVDPDDIEVVKPTESEVLTLFTCTGFLDSKRLIVRAYPVR